MTVAGGRFVVRERGPEDGPVVLCVHGFPDVPHTWDALARRLAASGHRVVSPYLRGYAPSTLDGPVHLRRIARDLVELAEALSPDAPVLVVGHDWGAAATYAAVGLAPERFARAVTLASSSSPSCPRRRCGVMTSRSWTASGPTGRLGGALRRRTSRS